MGCVGTEAISEFEFVQSLARRDSSDQCVGPLVTLTLGGYVLGTLEDSLYTEGEYQALWDGFTDDQPSGKPAFELCTAHWMDLAYRTGMRGRRLLRNEWVGLATSMLDNTCRAAVWDPKEISNLFMWRGVSLT